jgi:hypothetical protein
MEICSFPSMKVDNFADLGNVLTIPLVADGRALLVNARRGVVLHHFNFHKPVKDIQFSPNGLCVRLCIFFCSG